MFRQGRARVGCDAVRWQGATTLRARARKEEQRGQRAAARRNRVRSARYKLDLALEANKVSIHAVLRCIEERPGEICGLGAPFQRTPNTRLACRPKPCATLARRSPRTTRAAGNRAAMAAGKGDKPVDPPVK